MGSLIHVIRMSVRPANATYPHPSLTAPMLATTGNAQLQLASSHPKPVTLETSPPTLFPKITPTQEPPPSRTGRFLSPTARNFPHLLRLRDQPSKFSAWHLPRPLITLYKNPTKCP